MNKQRISIIIPVYNSEKYLDTCLNSLINQTFKDIEIICINDGSMDNSLNILEKYAQTDKRIIVINQENSGVAVARNKGLKTATGNYVMFCDSDDYYHTDMCKTMLNKLTKENVDTVMCSANVFSDFKSTRDLKMVQEQYDNKDHLCSLNDWKNKLLLRNELWNKIFKKEIIDKYHICFPEKIWCDDRAFIMKYLACSDNVFVLKDRLYNYRLTPKSYCENVHNKKYKNFYDTIFAMQDVKRFFTQNELMEKNKYYFADKINFSLFAYYGTCDKAHKKDFILKHKELITDLEFDEDFLENYPVINSLKKKGWKNTLNLLEKKENLSLLETIFSIKNRDIHKIITICGIKLKLKNKKLEEKQRILIINEKLENIEKTENRILNLIKYKKQRLNFRTFQNLTDLIRNNIAILPSDIDLVVGIPRSGVIPAYIIALFLNKNVCSLNELINNLTPLKGNRTINTANNNGKKILVVDDSINSGNSLKKIKEQLNTIINITNYDIEYCCIFATHASKSLVNYYFEIVEQPRIFQWNYLNHPCAQSSCFDMDGVLCVDPTDEQNDDGAKYMDFLLNAKPLYIPTYPINSIVTSRLEKYRPQTEEWLRKHNIKYKNLYMLDLPTAEERRKLNCHADFKANIFSQLDDCSCFIESNRNQARKIAELTGKQCICVETDEYFGG